MDEEKKTPGRARIYTGEPEDVMRSQARTSGKVRHAAMDRASGDSTTDRTSGNTTSGSASGKASTDSASGSASAGSAASNSDSGQVPAGNRRSRRAEPIGTKQKEHLTVEPGRRRKEMETEAKMRRLWALLGVLIVILVVAIVYEIVLGHATVETGSQRMNQVAQETGQQSENVDENENKDETEQASEAEENETELTNMTESGETAAADSTASGGEESPADSAADGGDGSSADTTTTDTTSGVGTTLVGLDG